jgi:hypothetical protein
VAGSPGALRLGGEGEQQLCGIERWDRILKEAAELVGKGGIFQDLLSQTVVRQGCSRIGAFHDGVKRGVPSPRGRTAAWRADAAANT